jgi:predicted Zn finger-like uncharacterized protein
MILECPHCGARLNAGSLTAPVKSVRCSKCKQVFQPQPPADAVPELVPAADDSDWSSVASSPPPAPVPAKTPQTAPAKARKFPTLLVGSGVAAVLAIVGAIIVMTSGGKSNPAPPGTDAAVVAAPAAPSKSTPRPSTPKRTPATPAKPQIPAEFADLFRETADRPPPVAQLPILKPVGEAQFPTVAFSDATSAAPKNEKLSRDELKKAAAYIETRHPDGTAGTGSGFAIQTSPQGILVATNFHVIGDIKTGTFTAGTRITVVFDSGLPTEKARPAQLIAADPEVDLAILKIAPIEPAPVVIAPSLAVKPTETMDVTCFGFPLGKQLSESGRRPNVSITKGAVSSLRMDAAGKLKHVQVNASLVPGNSGGPVVDADGRLVGIVVTYIPGTGIAQAIPAEELSLLMTGRVFPPSILPMGDENGQAVFQIEVPLSDPLRQVKEVALHLWTGDTEPKVESDASSGAKPLAGATRIPLAIGAKGATGSFKVAATSADKKPFVALQLEVVSNAGVTGSSPVVTYRLTHDDVQTASDAIPLGTYQKNLAKYSGQVVVVRGKLSPGSLRRGAVYQLQIADDAGNESPGLLFLADRDLVTQINELPAQERALDVRMTLRVGQAARDGATPARITRIDFIGRGNRLVQSIPSSKEPDDKLVALNRAPEKYIGQTITFPGLLSATILGSDKDPELSILFASEQRPENVCFSASPEIAKQLKALNTSAYEFYRALITVRIEPKTQDGTTVQIATVTKIELMESGKLRTIE